MSEKARVNVGLLGGVRTDKDFRKAEVLIGTAERNALADYARKKMGFRPIYTKRTRTRGGG